MGSVSRQSGRRSGHRRIEHSLLQCALEENSIRVWRMRVVSSGRPQLLHDDLAHVDNLCALFNRQCRGGVRAEKLIVMMTMTMTA